jgi:hypothetical protein
VKGGSAMPAKQAMGSCRRLGRDDDEGRRSSTDLRFLLSLKFKKRVSRATRGCASPTTVGPSIRKQSVLVLRCINLRVSCSCFLIDHRPPRAPLPAPGAVPPPLAPTRLVRWVGAPQQYFCYRHQINTEYYSSKKYIYLFQPKKGAVIEFSGSIQQMRVFQSEKNFDLDPPIPYPIQTPDSILYHRHQIRPSFCSDSTIRVHARVLTPDSISLSYVVPRRCVVEWREQDTR